jgi:hypothetical protein
MQTNHQRDAGRSNSIAAAFLQSLLNGVGFGVSVNSGQMAVWA